MRVEVDRTRCQGHGLCIFEAPEVFDLDDEGTAVLLEGSVPDAHRAAVQAAGASCPAGAIAILE